MFKRKKKRLYSYDNFEGDKGVIIAKSLEEACEIYKTHYLKYSWEKAERGVKNCYGGFIRWKEIGKSNKEIGCCEMEFDYWNTGSDHLMD